MVEKISSSHEHTTDLEEFIQMHKNNTNNETYHQLHEDLVEHLWQHHPDQY
jgi:hypothetical protein